MLKSGKVTMLFMTHLIHKEIDKDGKNLYRKNKRRIQT